MPATNKTPNTRGKKSPAASKKAAEKSVVKKTSTPRKTKVTAAAAEKKQNKSAAVVHLKAHDVPIVRGNGVLAVAFRKTLSESSAGRKKWDTVTRQAVEHFDGTWDTKTVVPYVLKKLGKNARFLCTNGDETTTGGGASSAKSLSRGSAHVWSEMSQAQIIAACQIKFNRIASRNEAESEESSNDGDHHDMDTDDDYKKAAAAPSVTPPPGATEGGSAGEATAEGKKAASSSTTAGPAAAAPRQQPTFFDRVRGLFGWGGVNQH